MTKKRAKHKRRRLFTRLKGNLPPLALTKRDLLILELVADYRFLNTSQIQALVGGSNHNVSERLSRLFHHGYLDRPVHQRELRSEGYRVLIHALGPKGAKILAEKSGEPGSLARHLGENNRTAKKVYLAHTLMVSQFRACLSLACQRHGSVTLAWWEVPERALARIQLAGRRVPVIPDAYFVLKDSVGRAAYFYLEADRGTMTQNRFLRKLQAYWRLHLTDSDIFLPRSFRVLTIARSQERMKNLAETAKDADPKRKGSRMFYFTWQDTYGLDHPEATLGYIWRSPADEKMHSLLEGKRSTAPN